ncbi:MAG: hypothetical protein LC795_15515 [Acidobacteria bacterium]|nr:hypothetical protein [Acidobacteriota bacterium]MCA1620684.1 hypothetical protein [Acidobacteriota bacterium]
MVTPSTSAPTKPRARRPKADDDAAANNPDILCHQIGLCKNIAELQAFISHHNLLNVDADPRFDRHQRLVIEAALDTMTEVLTAPPEVEEARLFAVPTDLARAGWKFDRDGAVFKLRKGQLATDGYVILDEAFEAARKLQRREGKRGSASPEEASGAGATAVTEIDAHQFKPTTSRNGRCSVCNKGAKAEPHSVWNKQQKERVKAGGPKLDAQSWRDKSAALTHSIAERLRPYDTPGRKTLRKIEEYESRVRDALEKQQWQATMVNIADAISEGTLPAILFGLSNEYQVRRLLDRDEGEPHPWDTSNMGQTIKTVADFKAAREALKPLIPEMLTDPNLDPRDGTEWATAATAGDGEPGSHAEAAEGSAYEGQDAEALLAATEREQRGRWESITLIEETLTTDPPKRRRKKLEAELGNLRALYEGTYSEVIDASGPEAAAAMRERVETEYRPDDAPASADPATNGDVVEHTPATEAAPVINASALLSKMAFPVPEPDAFDREEFVEAPELAEVAQELLHRFEELSFLYDFNLRFFWKEKGGATGSKNTLGKCVKPSGLLKKYSDAHFIVWVAADHTRHRLTNKQMEALLFHELMHCARDEKGRPTIRPHDFEGFAREIEVYGAWKGDIERIGKAFTAHAEQGSLF